MENQDQRPTPRETCTDEVEYVFVGKGTKPAATNGCAEECVGGTANTKAMQETNLA